MTDDSLVQCIHEIRRALATTRHAVLQTAARRGYRLVIPPEPVAVTPPTGASIAVLRFDALDPAGDGGYFADGLAEDLITSLSKIAGLFVIARNSSFAYRGGAVDLRRAAAELGVRYLLQGSVRRSGGGCGSTRGWSTAPRRRKSGPDGSTGPRPTSSRCRTG